MKILIVDDHPAIAISLARSLEQLGHTTMIAQSGAHALDLLDRSVDAIISDVEMPDMSGVDLARAVVLVRPGVRVAFYTASWDQQDIIDEALRLGRVMPKPWQRGELIELLSTLRSAA